MSKIQLAIFFFKRKVVTLKRIINFLQVSMSYFLRMKKVMGYPPAVMIEPTTYCNLKCPLCPTGNGTLQREKGKMTLSLFKNMIDEFGDKIIHLTLWGYGEPFIIKDIYEMIEYAKRRDIFVRTSTNGHFFSKIEDVEKLIKSGLDDLIIALDGASQETLSKYRVGANFEKIIKAIESISEMKKGKKTNFPFLELQFIVMKHNEHEIPLMRKIAQEVGANKLTIKTVASSESKDFIAENERLRRRVKKKKICSRLWFSSVVNWDGTVVPCCYDYDGKYTFGKLNYKKAVLFKDIWNNQKYINFRDKISKYRENIEMCRLCHGSFESLYLE